MSRMTMQRLIAAASQVTGIRPEVIAGPNRYRNLVHIRAAIVQVAYKHRANQVLPQNRFSFPQIGVAFGRDHSSIVHALNSWEDYCRANPLIAELPAMIEAAASGAEVPQVSLPRMIRLREIEETRKRVNEAKMERRRKKPRNRFIPDTPQAQTFHAMMAQGSARLHAAIMAAR